MIVLGIDPGTATTGFSIVKSDGKSRPELVAHGLIETSKDGHPGARLIEIYKQTTELLTKYKPTVVAMERIFFFINKKTVIRVSQAQGVLLLAAADLDIPVIEYAPGQIKLTVGGHGKADKKVMQGVIKEMFGVEAEKNKKTHFDNAADAIAIAVCHIRQVANPTPVKIKKLKPRKKDN